MALALELQLEHALARAFTSSPFSSEASSPSSSTCSTPSQSEFSTPSTSVFPSPAPSRKCSWTCPSSPITANEPTTPFPFLSLPCELRTKIYHLTLTNTTIHICSPQLRRRRGGPNRTKNIRRLPALLTVSKQIRTEALPHLPQHSTLAFSDFFNFAHLLSMVPESIANLTRRIALQGDVIVSPELLASRFPMLEGVKYTQLGNCVYAPSKENGFNMYASDAENGELVESVKARSASLVLLKGVLEQVNERRRQSAIVTDGAIEGLRDVELIAVANVLSARERVSLTININKRFVVSREVVAEGHFFD